MGQDKAQLPYNGNPWLFEQAQQIFKSQVVDHLVIVCQPLNAEIYQKTLQPLNQTQFRIQIVINSDPMSKPSDSIRCALKDFSATNGSFISPIDVPMKSEVLKAILFNNSAKVIRPTFQGRPGHPVWISGELLGLFLKADSRLDEFLRSFVSSESNVSVESPEILLNLNTPEAWATYLRS